jgi:hypothetical protein
VTFNHFYDESYKEEKIESWGGKMRLMNSEKVFLGAKNGTVILQTMECMIQYSFI